MKCNYGLKVVGEDMELFKAIILGIIQGLTEFLPVSSSGHLVICKYILGMKDIGISFDIILHSGTLAAVFVVYRKDIWRLIKDGIGICVDVVKNIVEYIRCKKENRRPRYKRVICNSYRKFAMLVIVSTIPTGIIGFLGKDLVERAGTTLIVPGICLLVTGTLLLISDNLPDGYKKPKATTYGNALVIGVCQGIATLPGISRSGTTITAGLLCGLKREFAVKYSFIMSIPAILGAAILDISDFGKDGMTSSDLGCYIAGAIVAAVVGYICIKTMLIIVRNRKFKYFAYYCYIIGAVAIIGNFIK